MQPPKKFNRVVNGVRYNVEKATLIADDVYWDGNNMERSGRNAFLYQTAKGRYFVVTLTQWQGERDTLDPVTPAEAQELYEGRLTEHYIEFEDAFPHIQIENA